jgi:hypothetical protein
MTLAWPFKPQMEIIETLEWLTDVNKCKKAEYRMTVRHRPRISYQHKYVLDAVDYGVARELARTIGGDPLYVPDWSVATAVPTISAGTVSLPIDVTYAPAYYSGFALVWAGDFNYEVVSITGYGTGTIAISATVNGYTNPEIVPLRLATFDQEFDGNLGAHHYIEASASFTATATEDLSTYSGGLTYPAYLGDPVVTDPVELINSVKEGNTRDVETLDSKTGPLYKYPLFATPTQSGVLAWTLLTEAALWALRVWLHTRRGRCKQFWSSSWNADVTITKDIVAGEGAIQIAAIGFASKYTLPVDIAIANASVGGMTFIRITSVSAGPAGNELLNFGGAFSGSTWHKETLIASKLTLSRLASDRIDIQHLSGRQATVEAATTEVPL